MRRRSKKTAGLYREHGPVRQSFLHRYTVCWACGRPSHDVHEMAKGSHRLIAFQDRAAWFAACRDCNGGPLNDYAEWPLERQLAAKLVNDPTFFDLIQFNTIRGRAPGAITLSDIVPYLRVAA